MILLCGIPSEGPIARVKDELDAVGAPTVMFNQRRFADMDMEFSVDAGGVTGWLRVDAASYRLEDFTAVYTRVMDDRMLPELAGEPDDSPRRLSCRALHETLVRWYEVAAARVVNRSGAMASNASKPFQAQLIHRSGLSVPDTLVTNDPEAVREFLQTHGRVVYKSVSGVRSVVTLLDDESLGRLGDIRWCPVQFQAFVDGTNVRVHTVGDEVIATAIGTEGTDYRYAHRSGSDPPRLDAVAIPDEVAERCLALSRSLELPVAGIDLKVAGDGRWFCFEVNPSPAFSYYESHTGQPIARTIARYLVG